MDSLELRRRNLPELDQTSESLSHPFQSRNAIAVVPRRLVGNAPVPNRPRQTGRYRRGMGMSSQIWWGGGGPPAYAEMRLNGDGTATLATGINDLGTGSRTIVAQVAAEEFGVSMEDVTVTIGDTIGGPFGPGSGGSITTGSITPAVRQAAKRCARCLLAGRPDGRYS